MAHQDTLCLVCILSVRTPMNHALLWSHHSPVLVPKAPLLSRLETVNGALFLRKMELETKLQLLKVTR